ncbi:hypothetical protein B0H14DRAFT_3528314 [Mycena olivaceomarginata]|nr:hypothetical protein B0H14DRAFT_3528314 [Mycena olivaceomarginata]
MNMMSDDYHGPWDTNVKDQAPVADPYASILDTGTGANLRSGGLAHYAPTYHLEDR